MQITPRAGWNARRPEHVDHVSPHTRRYFVVHHSGGPVTQAVRDIQDWCMNKPPHGRGFSDIDYNHLVRGSTGEIYEGRGFDVVGAHTSGYNTTGVGVCIIGTDQVSDAAKRSVRWLYQQYSARAGHELHIRGHRDLATTGTECPGDHTYAWLNAGMPAPPEEDDVKSELIAALKDPTVRKLLAADAADEEAKRLLLDLRTRVGKLQEAVTLQGRRQAAALGQDDIDEGAIVAGILAGLDPAAIAAAIPDELAEQVARKLADRLAA